MKIPSFITEFERKLNKAKSHGCELSDGILAFLLLDNAQLAEDTKKLVRATLQDLKYEDMKSKLMKIFGSSHGVKEENSLNVKIENLNIAEDEEEDVFFGKYTSNRNKDYQGRFQRYGNSSFDNKTRFLFGTLHFM